MELSALQLDALKELINIGVGKGASLLNRMLNKPIELKTIHVQIVDWHDDVLQEYQTKNASIVHMDFNGQINGRANLIFPNRDAIRLLGLIAPWLNVDTSISHVKKNVLTEVGNIVINGVIGSLNNVLNLHSSYTLPCYSDGALYDFFVGMGKGKFILANTQYAIEEQAIKGTLLIFLELNSFQVLGELLDNINGNA
ncbi:hypothetical protein KEM09_13740 [Carboxylicivirga mesophila]|uniref:Chemotaxis protein CheC n=1 Tax=Carboxylicivirga mesophila TaxID=1166478 RepID=A0ABS5KBR2_9BACT|nr:hypothetical protein [Carboxylicivirga mesophila]MBS2212473.1 hypothetical protein [Carboxylicivirga mesophila]